MDILICKQTDRWTDGQTDRQPDRQMICIDKKRTDKMDRQTDRQTDRLTRRQTDRHADSMQTDRQTDRQVSGHEDRQVISNYFISRFLHSKLGVSNNHHVVVYDNNEAAGIFSATRLWWTLRVCTEFVHVTCNFGLHMKCVRCLVTIKCLY